MNAESQHLDFLISQYVDGTLEVAGKKSVEQKLLTDPEARRLYTEHRDVQDLLDDYGSRIPLVNWGEFDKKLEARLEAEAREKQRASMFRRWLRPVAAAAALAIAATLGYTWHALSHEKSNLLVPTTNPTVSAGVAPPVAVIADRPAENQASYVGMRVTEGGAQGAGSVEGMAFGAPADQVALQALQTNVEYGFASLFGHVNTQPKGGSVVGAGHSDANRTDEPDMIQ